MDSTTNSGGGGGVEGFDSRSFFAATGINNTSVANRNSSRGNHFFDSLEPPSSSFHLPSPPTKTPAPASKNSKKRSRASRRAPTTVLTTDTSNFRAIVQEFTGIPAPPFSSASSALSSSSYTRSPFDFFNPTINAAASSSPSFLLKPCSQEFQIPNINASSVTNKSSRNNNNNNSNSTVIASPASFNYQSPFLNFQSLLQSQLAASGQADLGVKARQQPMMMPPTSTSTEYGLADLGLPGLIGSGWGQDASAYPTQLRQEVSNFCKLNYSAAAAGMADVGAADKGGEARGEGMVESWICSSD